MDWFGECLQVEVAPAVGPFPRPSNAAQEACNEPHNHSSSWPGFALQAGYAAGASLQARSLQHTAGLPSASCTQSIDIVSPEAKVPQGSSLHFACTNAPQARRHTASMVDSMPGDGTCDSAAHNFQHPATTGIDRHEAKAAGHSWQNVAHASAGPQEYDTAIGVHASKAAGQTWQTQGSQPVASKHASQTAGGRGHFGLGVHTESLAAMERAAKAQHTWAQITLQSEPEVQQNHGFLSSAIVIETLNRQRQAELLHLSHEGHSDMQASGLQETEQPGRTSPRKGTAVAASESSSGSPSGSPTSNRCVMHAADACAASSLLSQLL